MQPGQLEACLEDGVLWRQIDLQVFEQGGNSGGLSGAERVPGMLDSVQHAPSHDALNLRSQPKGFRVKDFEKIM